MIERHWTGIAKPDEADRYIEHLSTETFPQLEELDGFIKATILSRPVAKGTEFLIVTVWASLDSIRHFSGERVETAVVPDKVQAMMVEFDREARHYEVVKYGYEL
jgi:heme-degrading monooxygenase HmoA